MINNAMLSTKKELLFDATALGGLVVFGSIIVVSAVLAKPLAIQLFAGLIFCMILSYAIRAIYFRQRPDKSKVITWYDRLTQSSFPSLHSMRSITLGLLLANYFNNRYLWVFFPALILLVLYTRFALKRHYTSDIIAGAVGGIIISLAVIFFM
jgi:membrane-associated phospholipid phosphatase